MSSYQLSANCSQNKSLFGCLSTAFFSCYSKCLAHCDLTEPFNPSGARSLRLSRHPSLSCDCLFNCRQLKPPTFISFSIERRQLYLGFPLFRIPCRFHLKACLIVLVFGLRRVWPSQPQRLLMISVSFSLVRLFSTGPYLRWCQANKFAALFGFLFMSLLWVGLNISDLVLSSLIYFFYLTRTRCLKAGVQGTPTQRSSLTVSLTFFYS